MTSLFRTCLDGHRCENGSSCAEHPTEEGKYYCDCNTSGGDFAGLFCEYEAETYCQMPQQTSESWFCSNSGTCVLSTGSGQGAAWNCDCPADFEGPVCIHQNCKRQWHIVLASWRILHTICVVLHLFFCVSNVFLLLMFYCCSTANLSRATFREIGRALTLIRRRDKFPNPKRRAVCTLPSRSLLALRRWRSWL